MQPGDTTVNVADFLPWLLALVALVVVLVWWIVFVQRRRP